MKEVAVGTTQGNLSISSRATYLPLLMDFLKDFLSSLLHANPMLRLTAEIAKTKADGIFSIMFSGNDFFQPKIGSK